MLVVDSCLSELFAVVLLVLLVENVHKETVVLLENSILGGELKGKTAGERVSEARSGKRSDRLVGVEHTKNATFWL